jgi:hypothetical protein
MTQTFSYTVVLDVNLIAFTQQTVRGTMTGTRATVEPSTT